MGVDLNRNFPEGFLFVSVGVIGLFPSVGAAEPGLRHWSSSCLEHMFREACQLASAADNSAKVLRCKTGGNFEYAVPSLQSYLKSL